MVVPTAVRAGRQVALLAAFQSARGTEADDFTAAGAGRLWTEKAAVWAGPDVQVEDHMDSDDGPGSQWVDPEKPEASIPAVKGTPFSVETLLTSNYGALSGGSFSLASGISATRWLTLGWVEDRQNGASSSKRLVRIRDAWIHRVRLTWDKAGNERYLVLGGDYHGRAVLIQQQDAGGVTFPSTPMNAADQDVFPSALTTLTRDPAGANVSLRWRRLRITLDQGLGTFWDMGAGAWSVFKRGPLSARIEFTSDWSDETWALLDLARAGTQARYRVVSTSEAGVVLTIDLYGVIPKITGLDHEGLGHGEFAANGVATVVSGNLCPITMA